MRRSIQVVPIGNGYGFGSLGVPYASIHNQGGQISQAARSETFVRNRYKRGAKGKMFGGMGHLKKVLPGAGSILQSPCNQYAQKAIYWRFASAQARVNMAGAGVYQGTY
ncbi:hypothetical protein KRR40_12575 [Niabella defluvii]|nr:hypothetical protein KRR40_12575 [Niabella sp. I65]